MRNIVSRLTYLVLFLSVLMLCLLIVAPAQIALANSAGCVPNKQVENWTNQAQVSAHGFFTQIVGAPSTVLFEGSGGQHVLGLDVGVTPNFSGQNVASRITEIDTSLPVAQRVKCWQPAGNKDVVAEYVVRFNQAAPPPGLTENMFLWNAPFGTSPIPLTAIGVTRSINIATFQPQYSAIVAQDLVFSPQLSGLLVTQPMPTWLDPSDWHMVRVTVSQTNARIEVAQGEHPYTTVESVSLSHPVEPLGFEFSVDNEVFPGVYSPVTVPDRLDVGAFAIQLNQ